MHTHSSGSSGCHNHEQAHSRYVEDPANGGNERAHHKQSLSIVLLLSTIFLVVEIIAGFLTNSLALLSDAGHLFTDVGSMLLALFAMWMSAFPPNPKKTFGYYRIEILVALLNGVTLILVAFLILFEAFKRLAHPPEVHTSGIMIVAILGLLVNIIGLLVLSRDQKENLNLHGVFLHIMGDAISSLGTLAAALIMAVTKWYYADPIVSILIAMVIILSAVGLLNNSVNILMEGVPHRIDAKEILLAIQKLPGVVEVHDLHIWTLTSGLESLSTHILVDEYSRGETILQETHSMLRNQFHIHHVTVQVEKSRIEERYSH